MPDEILRALQLTGTQRRNILTITYWQPLVRIAGEWRAATPKEQTMSTTTQSWTERPHWVVMERGEPGEHRCAAHYEHEHEARDHARRRNTATGTQDFYAKRTG